MLVFVSLLAYPRGIVNIINNQITCLIVWLVLVVKLSYFVCVSVRVYVCSFVVGVVSQLRVSY